MTMLEHLDPAQRSAVEYLDGPQLVIAGAGAGKTRVLTYKVAYLLTQGYKPWNILALTFTNKAAGEMKERVAAIVGQEQARQIHMGTFHSVFARVLRQEATSIGYQPNFTIYDQADQRSLVKKIVKEMGYDEKQHQPNKLADKISMAKNRLTTPDQLFAGESDMPVVSAVQKEYARRCQQANAMDFDDLLLCTYRLFEKHDDIRLKYAERFKYVLVDEYQDTNYAQQCIINQLARHHQRLCVVGDDAQSIYAFRGAEIDNILNFNTVYPQARLFKLERNYRSTKTIVEAANSLIDHNKRQIRKTAYSEGEQGDKIALHLLMSDREEAALVAGSIERMQSKEQCPWSHFAILYRTNSQSRPFEEELRRRHIPHRIYGGLSFYQRKEIKDIMAYFRLVVNHNDEEAFRRIVNYPRRGIGESTMAGLAQCANDRGVSLWQVATNPIAHGATIGRTSAGRLMAFCQMVEQWTADTQNHAANTLGARIISESGIYKDIYSGKEADDIARQENLTQLLASLDEFVKTRYEEDMAEYTSLAHFMQEVALLTDLDSDDDDSANDDRVLLMTVHSAKGLEFPCVFVVGMEENIFPSMLSLSSPRQLEEERRLFYVAMTRASQRLALTCAENRFRYGRMECSSPSRFLSEIDPRYITPQGSMASPRRRSVYTWGQDTTWSKRPWASPTPHTQQPTSATPTRQPSTHPFTRLPSPSPHTRQPIPSPTGGGREGASSAGTFAVGQQVEHMRFGIGTIIGTEGEGENYKVKVAFQHAGTKQLLVKFANLKPL